MHSKISYYFRNGAKILLFGTQRVPLGYGVAGTRHTEIQPRFRNKLFHDNYDMSPFKQLIFTKTTFSPQLLKYATLKGKCKLKWGWWQKKHWLAGFLHIQVHSNSKAQQKDHTLHRILTNSGSNCVVQIPLFLGSFKQSHETV
jgi:hypothetical protein